MGGGFSYDTQKSMVILLAEFFFFGGGGGWGGKGGRNLHDFSIKSIYGTTTLMRFKDI